MTTRSFFAIALALFTLGFSCDVTTPDLSEVGTVRFLEIEGGCWVIETSDAVYEPTNLPEALREDGLGVTFQATVRDDLASICMVGPIVQLHRIQPNEG
jgi:hypothetical protein